MSLTIADLPQDVLLEFAKQLDSVDLIAFLSVRWKLEVDVHCDLKSTL